MSNIILPGTNGTAPSNAQAEDAGEWGHQEFTAKPVMVCDLDQTLRYNKDDPEGFINEPEEIAFYDHVLDAIWRYRDDGWLPVIVSNQGGVAHGYMEKKDLDRQMNHMQALAQEETEHGRGWPFLDTRFCMYDERAGDPMYGWRSMNRKPQIGALALIEDRAKANAVIPKWDESVMIGDRPEDEELAERAGIEFWPAEEWREAVRDKFQQEQTEANG